MKISVNWLKQFMDIQLPVEQLVERIGAQLGAVEEVIDVGAKYQGVLIVKVIACGKHPDADKLSLCLIDDGGVAQNVERNEHGYVQVVCGAPNVREGLLAAWIPPSVTVPATHGKDPFVLEARELRGKVSNGMLASASELAITDDHAGILEIDVEVAPGSSFAETYELNDYIIDIENKMFTHRPDCFGMLGVAREVAGISNATFISPDWYLRSLDRIKPGHTRLPLTVRNEAGSLVPRFMAVAMADVTVRPSPIIIQTYLSRVGLRPINNIVDVTNYLMILTGQPLHAYDYDKVKAKSGETPTIISREARPGEQLALLNGKTVTVDAPTVVIATDNQAIGIGGVMGGAETEVDATTTNIIIEVANFDMYNVRRTSMKYGLFTDAVTRFNKGQSQLQNDIILEEAVATMQYVSGAHVASDVFDVHEQLTASAPVVVSASFINERLGLITTPDDMAQRLRNVEFAVAVNGNDLTITAPFWRTDIHIKEDIVEEVGRLIGYDHLPLVLPKRNLKPAVRDHLLELKKSVRNILNGAGANEVLSYSFVHGNLLDKVGQDRAAAFKLSNALSPDLQYYRLSITPSLLEKVHPNIKAGYDSFALFEMGKTHQKGLADKHEPEVPAENTTVSLVVASQKTDGVAYYRAKKYLTHLLSGLNVLDKTIRFEPFDETTVPTAMTAPYDTRRSAQVVVNGEPVGIVGEFTSKTRKNLKLPTSSAGFEIQITTLLHGLRAGYVPLPKYPKVEQDICLKVGADMSYQQLYDFVWEQLDTLRPEQSRLSLNTVDIYQRADDQGHKQITFRVTIASYEKTMTAEEVNRLLDSVAAEAKNSFGAERI